MLGASWFAIVLVEISTRRILREKADCKQSTIDYIGCDFGIHFWARMTKAKLHGTESSYPHPCTMRLANLWTYQSRLSREIRSFLYF